MSAAPQQQQQQQSKPAHGPDSKLIDLGRGKGRVLCIADIRGDIEQLNRLVRETGATACIHTGDFGFYDRGSLERISDKTLKHLITYSPLIAAPLRQRLLAPNLPRRELLHLLAPSADDFHLAQFPLLFGSTPRLKLIVPTFVVYGACEDVRVIEKFRTGEFSVGNLHVLDEATTRAIDVGGVRLRLLGLGGAVVMAKMFDNGEGNATIAGGQGTMWTTALQIGELVDTAQRVYDPTETRVLVTHASLGREPLLALLALALKADLTVSSGLHFRYGAGWNEFSVQDEGGAAWWGKVGRAKRRWDEVWGMVRAQVEAVIEPSQKVFLDKTLAVFARAQPPAPGGPHAPAAGLSAEESAWKNTWSWNLTDSSFGQLVLDVEEGRVGAEMKSQGFNFSHRRAAPVSSSSAAAAQATASTPSSSSSAAPTQRPPPSGPSSQSQSSQQQQAAAPKGLAVPRNTPSPAPKPPSGPAAAKGRQTPKDQQQQQQQQQQQRVPVAASPAPSTNGTSGGGPKIERKPLEGGQQQQQQHKKAESTSTVAPKGGKPASPAPPTATSASSPAPSDAAAAAAADAAAPAAAAAAPAPAKKLTPAQRDRASQPPHTAYINGLPVPVKEDELRELFADAKEAITNVKFAFDHKGEMKRYCYVTFSDAAALDRALAAQAGRQIKGVSLKVVRSDLGLPAGPGPASPAPTAGGGETLGASAAGTTGRTSKRGGARNRKKSAIGGGGKNGGAAGGGGGEGASSSGPATPVPAPTAAAAAEKKD